MKTESSVLCFFKEKIQPLSEANISPYDIGLLRGYGCCDVLRAYGLKIFLLDRHLGRFFNSLQALNIQLAYSKDEVLSFMRELVEKNSFQNSTIRLIVTGGETLQGITFDQSRPTFLILVEPFVELPREFYDRGVTLISREYQRFIPEVKTLMYLPAVFWQEEKNKAGAAEILYTSDSFIRECSTSNFFMFRGDTLVTPKEKVLGGITRGLTLELAAGVFSIEERDIRVAELFECDEAFLTATNKKIVPVVAVNGVKMGNGAPGVRTIELMHRFDDFVAKQYLESPVEQKNLPPSPKYARIH